MQDISRLLITMGILAIIAGLAYQFAPVWLRPGNLPLDFSFGSGGFRVFIPLGTCLVLSLLLWMITALSRKLG